MDIIPISFIVISSRTTEPRHLPLLITPDDNHDVQWVSTSFTSQNTAGSAGPDNYVLERAPSILQPDLTVRATIGSLFVSVHDPPWATPSGLRAPPASRLLI